jgi:NCAIR mutase (PurE)-related protein
VNKDRLTELLVGLSKGKLSVEACLERLKGLPFEDLGFACIDHHRSLRTGFPEVIFGQGKTKEQLVGKADRLAAHSGRVLITRVEVDGFKAVEKIAGRRLQCVCPCRR